MSPTWFTQLGFGPTSANGLPAWNNLKFILPFFSSCLPSTQILWRGAIHCVKLQILFPPAWQYQNCSQTISLLDSGLIPWGSQVYEEKHPWRLLTLVRPTYSSSSIWKLKFKASRFLMKSQKPKSQFWFLLIPQVSAFIFIQSSMDSFFYANATARLNIIIIYLPVFHFIKNIKVIQGT